MVIYSVSSVNESNLVIVFYSLICTDAPRGTKIKLYPDFMLLGFNFLFCKSNLIKFHSMIKLQNALFLTKSL